MGKTRSVAASLHAVASREGWRGAVGLVVAVLGGVILMIWAASESRDNSSSTGDDAPEFPVEIGESAQADAPGAESAAIETSPIAASPVVPPAATPAPAVAVSVDLGGLNLSLGP